MANKGKASASGIGNKHKSSDDNGSGKKQKSSDDNGSGKKQNGSKDSGCRKKRQAISMETKVAIIKKLDSGEKMANVARAYGLNRSTIGTIYKGKDRIMKHVKNVVPMASTIISKKRGQCLERMEKLLVMWVEHERQRRMPLSLKLIQEKAISLFTDLKAKTGEEAADEMFVASRGWFARFKQRSEMHNIKLSGEGANLKGLIDAQQILNDETGLFEKKMPMRTYISREENNVLQLNLEDDFETIFESHLDELTNEDLLALEEVQRRQEQQEETKEETLPVKKFETKLLEAAFLKIEEGLALLEGQDPNVERFSKVSRSIHEALQCYRFIYDENRKATETSLDRTFKTRSSTTATRSSAMPSAPSTTASTSAPIHEHASSEESTEVISSESSDYEISDDTSTSDRQ
ncbi:jerky protein homolog-like isoform X2 [Antennarius striatus]